jgi:hypothetical protein
LRLLGRYAFVTGADKSDNLDRLLSVSSGMLLFAVGPAAAGLDVLQQA